MTDKYNVLSGRWADLDVLFAADLIDSIGNLKWKTIINPPVVAGLEKAKYIWHSATTLSCFAYDNGAYSTLYQSTDSGVNWTSKNTQPVEECIIKRCKADTTHAVAVERSGQKECIFTDDSGGTWTTKTKVTFSSAESNNDISFPTASLIVVAGSDAGGKNIILSTDDGGTWTDPTTSPSAEIYCVDMFDGTTGYAVDSSKNIWKTEDAGDVWVNTNDDITGTVTEDMAIYAVTADICLICLSTGIIEKYVNSTNTVTTVQPKTFGSSCGGIIKTTNGTIYAMTFNTTAGKPSKIFKSNDSGVTWESFDVIFATAAEATRCESKVSLVEIGIIDSIHVVPANGSGGVENYIIYEPD